MERTLSPSGARRRRLSRRAGALAGLLCAGALALALASTAGAGEASFALAPAPSLPAGATDVGSVPGHARLSLTLVLRPRDAGALARFAAAVSTPGSPSYHHFLSVAGFAARFGAAPATIASVRRTLRAGGLGAGALARNHLSIALSGSAARISRTFGVDIRRYRERSGAVLYANTTSVRLPSGLRGQVAGVLGLNDVPAAIPSNLIPVATHPARSRRGGRARRASVGPSACAAATSFANANPYEHTIDQIAGAYGMDPLYQAGDLGAGVTVALYELERYPSIAADVSAYDACFGTHPTVSTVQVAGGPAASAPLSEETAVDIQNIAGLAPDANIVVFQGPNAGSGVYDTLEAIVTAIGTEHAQVIEDSWGQCEQTINQSPGLVAQENTLLQEAAAQGQTFITSSGDRGSEGCQIVNDPNQTWGIASGPLAVEDPAAQPYATSVGGTKLVALGPPAVETGWNDLYVGAGGGGISQLWPMPSYQASLGAPGVINSYSSGSPCAASSGYCREVPDVSADASTTSGYVIYYQGAWAAVGGTSTAAPVWAGLTVLADAGGAPGCSAQTPLGFLNPLLYEVAAGPGYHTAFDDITTGDNNPKGTGPYPATAGYDMASGLGTPIATDGSSPGLVAQLCEANSLTATLTPAVSSLTTVEARIGDTITINGYGFTPFSNVRFGTIGASSVTYVNSGELKATVPPGSGIVNVSVTTTSGTSPATDANTFTYAPTASISAPAAGAGYTQGQPLTASYTCAVSTAGHPGCAGTAPDGAAVDTSSLGQHRFSVTATDANGFTATATSTYSVVPPPSEAIASPGAGAVYAEGQSVTAAYGCASTAPVTIASCSAQTPDGAAIDTSTPGAHTFTVTATDSNGVRTSSSVTYAVTGPPQASVTTPAAGAYYVRGASVRAAFQCAAGGPAPITSCSASAAAGAAVDTTSLGQHTFTVRATDSTGTVTTTTVTYTVVAPQASITRLRQAAAHWIEQGRRKGQPVGTTFSFVLDQPAKVTLRFARLLNGRMRGRRCLAPRATHGRGRSCTRSLGAGALSASAQGGADSVGFAGRIGSRRLAPGRYVVTFVAVGLGGRPSKTLRLRFTIYPPARGSSNARGGARRR